MFSRAHPGNVLSVSYAFVPLPTFDSTIRVRILSPKMFLQLLLQAFSAPPRVKPPSISDVSFHNSFSDKNKQKEKQFSAEYRSLCILKRFFEVKTYKFTSYEIETYFFSYVQLPTRAIEGASSRPREEEKARKAAERAAENPAMGPTIRLARLMRRAGEWASVASNRGSRVRSSRTKCYCL
jgi:hypothetical protein